MLLWIEHVLAFIGLITSILIIFGSWFIIMQRSNSRRDIVYGSCSVCKKCGMNKQDGVYHDCS